MKYLYLNILTLLFLACSQDIPENDELITDNNPEIIQQAQTSKIEIVEMPGRIFAYVRNVGPYMGDTALFGRLFNEVSNWAGPKGLLANSEIEAISVYHDDPESVLPAEQRISVGFIVPYGTKGEGDIEIMELPSGQYVVGSFELLPNEYGNAWTEVMRYVDSTAHRPIGMMYESYKNDPNEHPEGKHLVEICVAVEK